MAKDKQIQKQASLGKTFSLVAALTFASKVFGMLRDMFVASAFGTGMIADAYNYAYAYTGNFLVLFGGLGGPFHSSAVTVLTRRKDDPACGQLVVQLLSLTALAMGFLSILVWIFAPLIVHLNGSGMSPQLAAETISQLRIMVPLILIGGLVGIGCGISNAYGEVFWPSLAPAIASVAIIVGIIGFREAGGLCLAVGTVIGAVGQLLVQLPGMLKANPRHFSLDTFRRLEPGTKEYFSMLWPAAISTSIGQITLYVDIFFTAIAGEGCWTAINNGNRLVQLPLGILITAMLVPILPRFTNQIKEGKIDELKAELRRALSLLWFLALPLSAILIAIPRPIIVMLFQRQAFTTESTNLVVTVLLYLVPSIFFYVARDLVTRVFYAYQDTKTPYYVAMCAIAIKAFLDWLFVIPLKMGMAGIVLATTLITVFNLAALSTLLKRKIGNLGASALVKPVAIMTMASIVAGLLTYFVEASVENFASGIHMGKAIEQFASGLPLGRTIGHLASRLNLGKAIELICSVGLASALSLSAYAGICQMFKLEETKQIAKRLKLIK